jgi:hypothetical protein
MIFNKHYLNKQKIIRMMCNKAKELKTVIGKRVAENLSPTGTAKLIKIYKNYVVFESLQSEYTQHPVELVGVKYKRPIAYAWNAYFF